MEIRASQDLGGLGSAEGPPLHVKWSPSSPGPRLLPWLVLLGLLLLKANRNAAAWLIWVPVGCGFALRAGLRMALANAPSSAIDLFGDTAIALTFGIAAVWLLGTELARLPRVLVFFLSALVISGVGLVAGVFRAWAGAPGPDAAALVVLVPIMGSGLALAMTLAGLLARHRYRPFRLSLWIFGMAAGICLLVTSPFLAIAMAQGANLTLLQAITVVFGFSGGAFAVLLPFLILAFVCGLYRDRLRGMLRLIELPPVIPPTAGRWGGPQPGELAAEPPVRAA